MAKGKILKLDQAKRYLEVEHTDDDRLIDDLIEEAEARLQAYLERLIIAKEATEFYDGGPSRIFLNNFPIHASATFTVTDTHGTSEDATDDEVLGAEFYRIDRENGIVTRTTSNGRIKRWAEGVQRWQFLYTGGLDRDPRWSVYTQDDLRGSIRDLVADWYENRYASVVREGMGGGVSLQYDNMDIPERVVRVWDKYREPLL